MSLTPIKKLLNAGKRVGYDDITWDKQDDAMETLSKLLTYQSLVFTDLKVLTLWETIYTKNRKDTKYIVESTKQEQNILILGKVGRNIVECLDLHFKVSSNTQLMKEHGRVLLVDFEEKIILNGPIPEVAIIQLGFRRRKTGSYSRDPITKKKMYKEEDIKDSCDVEIPEMFQWKNVEFVLVAVFCHHGPEPTSGHFTNYLKHVDKWYHHNDDMCTPSNIEDFLPLVCGGNTQTCCAVAYRTRKIHE